MFDSATTIGLLLTLVMIFSFQGNTILEKPLHIVLIAVPLILQTFLIFAIAYIACRVSLNWLLLLQSPCLERLPLRHWQRLWVC